jgi:hypothetical protein
VTFIDWILQLFVAQIDGKFLVHAYEAARLIINFLRKSYRVFARIHFFDVTSASTGASCKFANVSSATIRQSFPNA